MSTEYRPLDILETLQTHLPIPAQDGPGYCRGCDWESRQIGISSHLQHRAHVAEVIEAQIDAHDRAVKAEALREAVREINDYSSDSSSVVFRNAQHRALRKVRAAIEARADEMEKEATDE